MISHGDFSGMGTATMPFRILQFLAEGVLETGRLVRGKVRESRRRRSMAPAPLVGTPGVVIALEQAVASGRLASSSARKYREVISHFAAGLAPARPAPVEARQVERFLEDRDLRGIGRGARRVDLAALRTVFDKLLGNDVTAGLPYPARPVPVPASRPEEVGKMLAASADDRDRLLLLLLNAAKLRPGQIASLTLSRIDRQRGAITVPKRKSAEFVEILLPESARKLLEGLLVGHDAKTTEERWLFQSPRHPQNHLTVRAIQKRLRQLAETCGVDATPTGLRKANSLWQATGDEATSPAEDQPTREIANAPYIATPRPKKFCQMDKRKMPLPIVRRSNNDCDMECDNRPVSPSRRGREGRWECPPRGKSPPALPETKDRRRRRLFSNDLSIGKGPPPKWEAHQRNLRIGEKR